MNCPLPLRFAAALSALACCALRAASAESDLAASTEAYDYAPAMKAVAAKFTGKPGVIVLLGDSITYASPATAWARGGGGKNVAARAFLKWSHAGEGGDADGWTAAKVDAAPGRSHTAAGGVTTAEFLAGGKNGLPPLADIIKRFNPQIAVYMLGTNDIGRGLKPEAVAANVEKSLDALLANGTVPILSTIPPITGKIPEVEAYNAELKKLAAQEVIPLLDLFGEMKARNPELAEWLADGVHPTAGNSAAEPEPDNLKKSGYLLRCYVNVLKAMEVKARVLDAR